MLIDKEHKELQDIVNDLAGKIDQSAFFLSLFTEKYSKDPVALMQLGMGIVLDKPIYILAPHGSTIPTNISRLAYGLFFYNPDDKTSVQDAMTELTRIARGNGHFDPVN